MRRLRALNEVRETDAEKISSFIRQAGRYMEEVLQDMGKSSGGLHAALEKMEK